MNGANLNNANLSQSNLNNADLSNTELTKTNFLSAGLCEANFLNAKIRTISADTLSNLTNGNQSDQLLHMALYAYERMTIITARELKVAKNIPPDLLEQGLIPEEPLSQWSS